MPKPSEHTNLLGAGITILALVGLSFFIDIDMLKEWVVSAGPWAPILFISLKVLTIVAAPISGSPLYPLVGMLFGFFPGFLYVALGDLIGYSLAFFISRRFGRDYVLRLIAKNETGMLAKIVERLSDWKSFFVACFAFAVMPELLAYGAGLSRLPYYKFILTLWPLALVGSATLVFFGSKIEGTAHSLISAALIPLAIGTVVLIGGGFVYYKYFKDSVPPKLEG